MAIRPFANAPHADRTAIATNWLIGVQTGNTPNAVAEMKYLTFEEFTDYIKSNYGAMWRYRGESSSATPTDPEVNDYFICTGDFAEGGQSFAYGHVYAYNGNSWDDVSLVLNQYAQQSQVDDIDERLVVAEEKIDALSGFIFKGEATRATLPTPSASNQGWVYYLTDENIYVASNGSQWVTVMNYVVQTVTEGDTGHAPSGDAVYKALAQRDAKDADLQSQIMNTNAELDNVEALIGGDAQVENTDPTEGESLLAQSRIIHHANLLPNGSFGRVGARSVAWNQLVKNPLFVEGYANWGTVNPDTISVSDGVATVTHNGGTSTQLFQFINAESSHVYFVRGWFKTSASCRVYMRFGAYVDSPYKDISANTWVNVYGVVTGRSGSSEFNFYTLNLPTGNTLQAKEGICVDLTIMSMATGYTVDQLASIFCGSYSNDTGHIYDLNPTAFRIRGINLWDEEWESGRYSLNDGSKISGATSIRNTNLIPCLPSTQYYAKTPAVGIRLFFYDANKAFIPTDLVIINNYFTTAPNCCYFAFQTGNDSNPITSYGHDVQFCYNSLPASIKTQYHASEHQIIDTSDVPVGYVDSEHYNYKENVVVDGVMRGAIHDKVVLKKVLTGDEPTIWYSVEDHSADGFYMFYLNGNNTNLVIPNHYNVINNQLNVLMCDRFEAVTRASLYNAASPRVCIQGGNFQFLMFVVPTSYGITTSEGFKTWLRSNNTTLWYWADPSVDVPTYVEPLRSFSISAYATVEPITPQTELVNRIDVPFSVKTISANTLIEQITQNTADIAEEKATRTAQVSALDKRVTNLELKTGDQFDVDYPSPTYGMNGVPSNVEPYAKVKRMRGVLVAYNQLNDYSQYSDYGNAVYKIEYNGYQAKLTVLSVPQTTFYNTSHPYMKVEGLNPSHKILITGTEKRGTVAKITERRFLADGTSQFGSFAQRIITGITGLLEYSDITTSSVANDVCSLEDCFVYDLTQALGPSVADYLYSIEQATTGAGVALFRALVSAQNKSYEAGRLVSTTYEAVKSVGVNLCDGEFEVGTITSEGVPSDANQNSLRSKNYNRTYGASDIYVKAYNYSDFSEFFIYFYDTDKNFIIYRNVIAQYGAVNVPSNAVYWKARFYKGSTVVVPSDPQIMVNRGTTALAYSPYMTGSLPLPEPITLRGILKVDNGNLVVDGDEYDPETGEIERYYRLYTFTGNEVWDRTYLDRSGYYYFSMSLPWVKIGTTNLKCVEYVTNTASGIVDVPDKTIAISGATATLYIRDDSVPSASDMVAHMAGKELICELATPTSDTPIEPLVNPFILVEGGGTVDTEQTNDPMIASAMTLEYMAS